MERSSVIHLVSPAVLYRTMAIEISLLFNSLNDSFLLLCFKQARRQDKLPITYTFEKGLEVLFRIKKPFRRPIKDLNEIRFTFVINSMHSSYRSYKNEIKPSLQLIYEVVTGRVLLKVYLKEFVRMYFPVSFA